MCISSPRAQIVIGIALATLMAATRGHHFGTLEHLPSASWAVLFLAGCYLSSRWVFPALLAEAALLDVAAVTWGGVDNFCVSPAYGFLLPAYGVLWGAGRWYAARHQENVVTLLPLAVSLVFGAALCELISSGGFYFFSGRFEQTNLTQFAMRLVTYFPGGFSAVLFYVGIAGGIHTLLSVAGAVAARTERFRTSS
ncbi:hypothetical protein [Nitrospira lenta]|uniref:Cobalamin ABC transporter n=1 Tax=Nitrospira lenta TaxID=1436998 RepID=A0A330LBK9_9BACT|nr:hypothetical protein [Nitrospira lenta]SPP66476.1 conserved membrane hypothetical protein [Nitrospira lenta]